MKNLLVASMLISGLLIGTAPGWGAEPAASAAGDALYTFKEEHDRDGIGKFYYGREISHVMGHLGAGWLERSSREREEAPTQLMDALGLKAGMVVADIGAGSGYFTRRLARRVGETGKVMAVDIQPEMIEILTRKMKDAGLSNFETVLGTEKDPKLPANSVDLVLMVDVYHEFSYPHEMMLAIKKALKPKGRVVFVEYRGEDDWVPIKRLHKMTQAQVKKETAAQGFRWVETIGVLPRQHIIIVTKD